MKILYPNKTEVNNKKIFIYKVNNKDYLFYVTNETQNNMETVCFGELKENSLFGIAAEDLENFKVFLSDLVNNKAGANPNYVLQPVNDGEITIYGGSKTQIPVNVIESINFVANPMPEMVLEQPIAAQVSEPTPQAMPEPVMEMPAEPVQEVQPTQVVEPTPQPMPAMEQKPVVEEKKKKKSGLGFFIILLILAIIGGATYVLYMNEISNWFSTMVNGPKTNVEEQKKINETPKQKVDLTLNCNVTQSETGYEKNIETLLTYSSETNKLKSLSEIETYTYTDLKLYEKEKEAVKTKYDALKKDGVSINVSDNSEEKTIKIIKNYVKGSVSETRWQTIENNSGTLDNAKVTLEQAGNMCNLTD